MQDTYGIVKVSDPCDQAGVANAQHDLPGQVVNGLLIESVGFCEPVHVEGGAWVSRCYVEGWRVDVERAPVLYLPVT